MAREARMKSRSGIYHIMWRGANRQEIFHDEDDCYQFLDIMKKYKQTSGISIYAWCLMSNHVHLLVKEGNEEISDTMKRIGVSFVWYYNEKYKTTGHLFQDRFRSENVESNRYLFTVIRYIHQNPVKAGIVNRVNEWRWSSCPGYFGETAFPKQLLDQDIILKKLSDNIGAARESFREFNERNNNDNCLEDEENRRRLTDEEARIEIKELLGVMEIAHIKSLPKLQRNEVLQKVKKIKGLSQRQAARIIGISPNLINKV